MKNPISAVAALLAILLIPAGLNAQADSLENLPNLLLPRFTNSLVKMKSGEKRRAVLNYNLIDQEMVFMQRGQFYVLDDPQLIDTVYMANRTFVPFEKGFYELAVAGPATLFIQHKAYAESLGVPTAYGARSQTTSYNYVKMIFGGNGAINLRFPDEFGIVDDTEYWIKKDGVMFNFKSQRQFFKIFPEKKKEIDRYISENQVDFKNKQDVISLVQYCNLH
jgi:hypothetical protein